MFSLIVIWLTLREMRIQRHKTFEPYILPLNFEIIFLSKYPEILLPIKSYLNREQLNNKETNSITSIQLKNIGQGVAKDIDISIEWDLEYKDYLNKIISEFKRENIDIGFRISDNSFWINLDESIGVLSGGNFPFQNNQKLNYDYLLPIKESNDDIKIELPSSLSKVMELSILLIECLPDNEKKKAFERFRQILHIKMKINYKDNLEKTFCNYYNLKIGKLGIHMESDLAEKMYKLTIEREK